MTSDYQLKESDLRTAKKREKIPPRGRPYCVTVGPGVRLGYRRTKNGHGTWVLARADGKGTTIYANIAPADDRQDANGSDILDYWQAVTVAQNLGRGGNQAEEKSDAAPLTVDRALANYRHELIAKGGDPGNVVRVVYHLPDWLKNKLVSLLTPRDIKNFRDHMVARELAAASVNRTMRAFCAALNLAAKDYPEQVKNAPAWRERESLPDAENSNNIILSDTEVAKMVRQSFARHGERFGTYIWVHAETGARTSQINRLRVDSLRDADANAPWLLMPSARKGKTRKITTTPVQITPALAQQLLVACGDRADHQPLLLDDKGRIPGQSFFQRRIPEISKALKLPTSPLTGEQATLYALRHSSIVRGLLKNRPIRLVAATHDTSVEQIEATYAKYITTPGAELMRGALIAIDFAAERQNVVPMKRT
jgi:integrase